MFGYAAAGNQVAIVAIQIKDLVTNSRLTKPTQTVLAEFDISNPIQRLRLLVCVLNILRVLNYYVHLNLVPPPEILKVPEVL